MNIIAIHRVGASLLVLGLAAGCTVTTDKGGTGDSGSGGASSAGGAGSSGKNSGGASGAGGNSSGGSAGTGGLAASGGASGHAGELDGSAAGAGGAVATEAGTDGAAGGGVSGSDPCGSQEATANDDRDHSTPYALGTEFDGCLQSDTDIDFYSYTIPSTPAQGGYVVVSLTQVGSKGGLNVTTQAVADNGDVTNSYGGGGQSVFHWFNAKAGASFRLKIGYFSTSKDPTPYTLKVTYTGVPDKNEPNDTRQTATPIMDGKAVTGYLFGGYENATSVPDAAWEDWFKVTLPAGMATVTLADLASDIDGEVTLYDSNGAQIVDTYEAMSGASVVINKTVTAGDYFLKVRPFSRATVKGSGSTVPAYLTQPYTFTATVK